MVPCRRCEDGSARKHLHQDEALCLKCCLAYPDWDALQQAGKFALDTVIERQPSPLGPGVWDLHLQRALNADLYETSCSGVVAVSYSHTANQPVVIIQGPYLGEPSHTFTYLGVPISEHPSTPLNTLGFRRRSPRRRRTFWLGLTIGLITDSRHNALADSCLLRRDGTTLGKRSLTAWHRAERLARRASEQRCP